jgi:hypothetical protein
VYNVPNGTIFRTKKLQLFTVLAEHKAFIEGVPIIVKCLDSVVSSFLPWAEVSKSFSSFKLGVKLGGGGGIYLSGGQKNTKLKKWCFYSGGGLLLALDSCAEEAGG